MSESQDLWTERRSGRRRHPDDARTDFEVDYARVIHSGSFRRLQGKTQILSLGDDDFYRTRLTHSMEVAQVAEGIAQQLRTAELPEEVTAIIPPTALIAAIGLAHDIGHPPFGHGGELALNYCMRDHGGFEGNAQTLRIVARLETFSDADGADLTRRSLLGVLKYPATFRNVVNDVIEPMLASGPSSLNVLDTRSCKPPKAVFDEDAEIIEWALAPLAEEERRRFQMVRSVEGKHGRTVHKSFDCSIMDAADDIAYGVHDLEDAIALGFISENDFRAALDQEACSSLLKALSRRPLMPDGAGDYEAFVGRLFGDPTARKGAIGRLVHHFIRGVEIISVDGFDDPLLTRRAVIGDDHRGLLKALQSLIVERVIDSPRVQHLEFKGQRMVVSVFEALMTDPRRLLPADVWRYYREAGDAPRIVCDHVASFTDAALLRTYERLFSPRSGSVFDRV